MAGSLGVHIDKRDDGKLELIQKDLTDRIVNALGLEPTSNTVKTPAEKRALGADIDGPLCQ